MDTLRRFVLAVPFALPVLFPILAVVWAAARYEGYASRHLRDLSGADFVADFISALFVVPLAFLLLFVFPLTAALLGVAEQASAYLARRRPKRRPAREK